MDEALSRFLKDGFDPEQLDRLKMQIRAQQIYARDNVDGIARRYGAGLSSGLTVADIQAWPEVLDAVTEADVMAMAQKIFNRKASVTGWLMKEEEPTQ